MSLALFCPLCNSKWMFCLRRWFPLSKKMREIMFGTCLHFFFFFFQRLCISGCVLRRMCVSEQNLDHVQLFRKLVSASSHYELILEPAAIERRKWLSLHCCLPLWFTFQPPEPSESVHQSVCLRQWCMCSSDYAFDLAVFLCACLVSSQWHFCACVCMCVFNTAQETEL